MRRLVVLLAVLCSVSAVSPAGVSIVNWNVGDPGTTYQKWSFDSAQSVTAPDAGFLNPGAPVAEIAATGFSGSVGWQQGAWIGTKFKVTIDIPNFPAPNPYKEVLVEVIYKGTVVLSWVMDDKQNEFSRTILEDSDMGNGWKKRVDLYSIAPNPPFERVCYGFNPAVTGGTSGIDSIAISTICVPEPLTLAILGLGLVALSKKK